MAGIAIFFAVLIIIISRFCEVKGDPRVPEIVSHLSGANCGGCGHPGCEGFARARWLKARQSLDDCGQTTKANKIEISNILGINYSGGEETVAVVACCGGIACDDKYSYQGYGSCISQQLLADGRKKKCEVGCMGAGSCVDVCPPILPFRFTKGGGSRQGFVHKLRAVHTYLPQKSYKAHTQIGKGLHCVFLSKQGQRTLWTCARRAA